MNREEIRNSLQEIFKDVFDDDSIEIEDSTSAADIEGWDSLTYISILAAVQDEFHVSFDMDEIVAMKNVGEMIDAISKKM